MIAIDTQPKKYSVILPVRNGGNYIKDCVNSILSQTLQDFNLIILDNNSKDGTIDWLEKLHDERITIHLSSKDLTIEENWKRITSVDKNEFITLIGHDDLLEPHFLATIDTLIKQHPTASLFTTHFNYIDAAGNTIRNCKPMDCVQQPHEFLSHYLCSMIDCMGTGFVMRATDYDSIGGIPTRYPNLLYADFELWILLTGKGFKVTAFVQCFSFRLHQSATTSSSDDKFQRAFFMFIEFLATLRSASPLYEIAIERYGGIYLDYYVKGLSHRLLRNTSRKKSLLTVKQFLENTQILSKQLLKESNYQSNRLASVRLAQFVDSNLITRTLFVWFKKVYAKPIL